MKKTILKFLLLIVIVAAIAGLSYLILYLAGFTTLEDFIRLKDNLGDSFLFWFVIVLLQIFQTIFIPISNQLVTGATAVIFNDQLWKVWLSAAIGISIGSFILYLIGRFGGQRIVTWLLGDKQKAEKLKAGMRKGKGFYVIGMHLAPIPDDILSTLAGVAKYNVWFTLFITIEARFICTAFTTWGIGLLTQYWWMWIVAGVGIVLILLATFIVYKITFKKEPKDLQKQEE
jgi:uncharacterized membrane protein YdjX (TVP38/TMEM64 family)